MIYQTVFIVIPQRKYDGMQLYLENLRPGIYTYKEAEQTVQYYHADILYDVLLIHFSTFISI